MRYLGRGIAMPVAGLAMILAVVTSAAERKVTVYARNKAFCTRLIREAHRVERIAPILKMPVYAHYVDTRVHKHQGWWVKANKLYFIDKRLPVWAGELDKIMKRKDWRKVLFKPGSPVPLAHRKFGYWLVYDEEGYWRTLERRAPGFLLDTTSDDYGPTTQAPDWFAIYAVDLDGDGLGELVLHRRFGARGGNKSPTAIQYLDRIDLKTGRKKRVLEIWNHGVNNYLVQYVRYRGRVYIMGQDDAHVWFGAIVTNPKFKHVGASICSFFGITDFNDLWRYELNLEVRP